MKRKIISIVLGITFIIVLTLIIFFPSKEIISDENYDYLKFTLINENEYMVEGLEETNEIKDNSEVVLDKVESENIDISIENNEVEKENETLESSETEEEKLAETKIEVKEELEKDTLKWKK